MRTFTYVGSVDNPQPSSTKNSIRPPPKQTMEAKALLLIPQLPPTCAQPTLFPSQSPQATCCISSCLSLDHDLVWVIYAHETVGCRWIKGVDATTPYPLNPYVVHRCMTSTSDDPFGAKNSLGTF